MRGTIPRKGSKCSLFIADGDGPSVRKLVALLQSRRLSGGLKLLLKIQSDIAKLLFDVPHDFPVGRGGELVPSLHQILGQVVSKITTSNANSINPTGKTEAFIDGDSVRNTVTRVQHDASRATRGVEGEDGLDGNIESGDVERLEHDLRHLLSVHLGAQRRLSEQHRVLLGCDTKFVVERVVPDFLHVVPVGDDAVLDGVV